MAPLLPARARAALARSCVAIAAAAAFAAGTPGIAPDLPRAEAKKAAHGKAGDKGKQKKSKADAKGKRTGAGVQADATTRTQDTTTTTRGKGVGKAKKARAAKNGGSKAASGKKNGKTATGTGGGTTTPTPVAPTAPTARATPTTTSTAPAPTTSRRTSARKRRTATGGRAGSSRPRLVPLASLARGGSAAGAALAAPPLEPLAHRSPSGRPRHRRPAPSNDGSSVTRTVRDIVEVVPGSVRVGLAALAALSVLLAAGYGFAALRARRLTRHRRELLQEVGLLQSALLPPVPEKLGALRASVAYRPADGPGAGGDFYDALTLPGGRTGFILGDVSGHGRAALARTAFMRYTLRAYLEAGLEPRVALQVAGRVIGDHLEGDFATVVIATHDRSTGSLTFASAGHPSPIVVGQEPFEPVLAGSSPPIGVGVRTGLRQTTVPLAPGSRACFFTDGLTEARTHGGILGRGRLKDMVSELPRGATAQDLLERVAAEARLVSDDMAACLITPTAGVTAGGFRNEQLELSGLDLAGSLAEQFLDACEVTGDERAAALRQIDELGSAYGGVIVHVLFGNRRRVEVLPRNVESIEAASRRVALADPPARALSAAE